MGDCCLVAIRDAGGASGRSATAVNVILILCDTLRRDHAGGYGGGRAQTPCLERLASQSVVFDRALAASYPTLPCRAELFTGRFIYPYLTWGPLPCTEVLLSELLGRA